MIKVSPRSKKISFELELPNAEAVAVVGDFNNWDGSANPMKFSKRSGVWKTDVKVDGGAYEFRYLVNNSEWVNDAATPTVPNSFGTENSLAEVVVAKAKTKAKKAAK